MSYKKLGFVSGQTLKAEHLNYMEDGIANAASAGGAGGAAIIDVIELPTENINEGAFYRLMTAKFVSNFYSAVDGWTCHVADGLPSVGEPVSTDMVNITGYYNVQDNEVYGYADSMISAAGGVPVGWYPIGALAQAFNINWGGAITDASEMGEDTANVLLSKEFYMYQDGWCKVPFAYEKAPEFDIQWDGEIGDRFALDMSLLGFENTYFVKVSDLVVTSEDAVGCELKETSFEGVDWHYTVTGEGDIDTSTYAGAISIYNEIVSVYSEDELNTALGLPAGYITNGTYFVYIPDSLYASRLVAPSRITKIDSKYLDIGDVQVDLSNYPTTSQVETMIENAIGSAIRGSY